MKIKMLVTIMTLLFFVPIAALAADEQPLSAAAGFTTDTFTLFWKIGVPSGCITGVLSLLGIWWTNRTTQKNNREKIAAEAENISRQLNQRQHEFEIQTKMQIESLHSDEKKKVCWDFLASVEPLLFANKQFDREKMADCILPLYLYSQDNHYSYFKNVMKFVVLRDLTALYDRHKTVCQKQKTIETELKRYENLPEAKEIFENIPYKIESCHQELGRLEKHKVKLDEIINLYGQHYDLAVEAAKKLIWNEPIEKAQLLCLASLPDEDDI